MLACLLVLQKHREDASMDLLAHVASLVCGVRVKLSFSAPGAKSHGGLSLACATSAMFSMPEVRSLGTRRSDANLNKLQMFLSALQRIQDVESVLHCCNCRAGCCDVEGLISRWSYSLRIQLENICPGGRLLWFRCVMVALG